MLLFPKSLKNLLKRLIVLTCKKILPKVFPMTCYNATRGKFFKVDLISSVRFLTKRVLSVFRFNLFHGSLKNFRCNIYADFEFVDSTKVSKCCKITDMENYDPVNFLL